MTDAHTPHPGAPLHPVHLEVSRPEGERNRLTTFFRILLGFPHILIVGGPIAAALSAPLRGSGEDGPDILAGSGAGALGVVAGVCALIAWFAILFTGRHPDGLWKLSAFYLGWRVRAVAYLALLRDEYPPFGEGPYPVQLTLPPPPVERDRVSVGLRIILALPHIFLVWALGVAWMFSTLIAWFAILFTGRYPAGLYAFGVGVMRWNTRLEAYLLLLHDEYPPFSMA